MGTLTVNLGLPARPLVSNPEAYGESLVIYNAIRILTQAFDDIVNELILVAFESISVGQVIAIYNDAGIGKFRKALDATYYGIGFCAASVSAGQSCRCVIRGRYPAFPAATLTPGTKYYLSTVSAGTITTTAGNQLVGIAQSDTTLLWRAQL